MAVKIREQSYAVETIGEPTKKGEPAATPHPKNPRNGNLEAIAASMLANGIFGAIRVQASTGHVIAGNHTLRAAMKLGAKRIPVIRIPCTDAEAERLGAADNKTHDDGDGYDPILQFEQLTRIAEASNGSLEGTGFSQLEYNALASIAEEAAKAAREVDITSQPSDREQPKPDADDDDIEAMTPTEPVTQLGDIWILGEHRLMCGDCFLAANRVELFGRERIDMNLHDPPYAIYGSSTGIGADIADDKMIVPFFTNLTRMIANLSKDFAHVYLCCDWRSYPTIASCAKVARLSAKNCLIWDKGGGLGASYANCYEMIGFWAKLPPPTAMKSTSQRGQRTVMAQNVVRMNRVAPKDREHNAAKPIPMFEWLIGNSSDPGDLVADFFGGSGTTILAAENTRRRCYSFELEPRFCDLIVRRWEKLTGKKAKRIPQSERQPAHVPEEELHGDVDTTP